MMLTDELQNAIDIVCAACPYISDCEIDEELSELAYSNADSVDTSEKYCSHCMVRNMYNLYSAMDETNGDLPYTAPEWQAIINY